MAAKGTGGSIGDDFGSAAHADNSADNTSSAKKAYYGSTWSSDGGYKVATSDTGDVTITKKNKTYKIRLAKLF